MKHETSITVTQVGEAELSIDVSFDECPKEAGLLMQAATMAIEAGVRSTLERLQTGSAPQSGRN